jgi:hypothetical protein
MKAFVHLWQYVAQFFLEYEMFLIKDAEKLKKHIFTFNNFFLENHVYDIMWKNVE